MNSAKITLTTADQGFLETFRSKGGSIAQSVGRTEGDPGSRQASVPNVVGLDNSNPLPVRGGWGGGFNAGAPNAQSSDPSTAGSASWRLEDALPARFTSLLTRSFGGGDAPCGTTPRSRAGWVAPLLRRIPGAGRELARARFARYATGEPSGRLPRAPGLPADTPCKFKLKPSSTNATPSPGLWPPTSA